MLNKLVNKISPSLLAHLLVISVCCWIYWVNKLPSDYIVSGTDHTWFLNFSEALKTFFYTWTNGVGYGEGRPYELQAAIPFYLIQYLAVWLGFSASVVQSLMLPFFIYASFISFYLALRVLKIFSKDSLLNILFSFAYGINGYTLFLFMHVFGYFYQQVIYIFVPLLISIPYSIIVRGGNKKKYFALFILGLVSSMGFNNPGFIVALNVYLFLIFSLAIFLKDETQKVITIIRSYFLSLLTIALANAYWLTPYFFVLFDRASSIVSGNPLWDLDAWIKWQSTTIIDVIRFIPVTAEDKFPLNSNLPDQFIPIFLVLSFFPILYFLISLIKVQKQKIFITFSIIYLILILLIAKVTGPLGDLSITIFKLPIINSLRSFDKFFVFLPFTTFIIIYLGLIQNTKIPKYFKYIVIASLLIYPTPFYTGKVQQNLSASFTADQNYLSAPYSNLVKVPEDYYEVSNTVNNFSPYLFKVQYLPFGVTISPGWSQYPKWQFRGNDITTTLFEKPVQRPSNYLAGGQFNYGQIFNASSDPTWFPIMMGLMNNNFLVFNKDVGEEFLKQSENKIASLVDSGSLIPEYASEFIELYSLKEEFFIPQFYTPKEIIFGSELTYTNYPNLLGLNMFTSPNLYIGEESIELLDKLKISEQEKALLNPKNIGLSHVNFLDLNSPEKTMSLKYDSKVYTSIVPKQYLMSRLANKIILDYDYNFSRTNIVEEIKSQENKKPIEINVTSREILVNDNYFNDKTNYKKNLLFDEFTPNLEVKEDFVIETENLIIDPSFESALGNGVNNCGNIDTTRPVGINGNANIDATDGNRSLEINSTNGTACTALSIETDKLKPGSYYKISFDYRSVAGHKIFSAIWQTGAEISSPIFKSEMVNNDWQKYEQIFKVSKDTTDLRIFFYADSSGGKLVSNRFDNAVLVEVVPTKTIVYPIIEDKKLTSLNIASSSKITLELPPAKEINLFETLSSKNSPEVFSCGRGNTKIPLSISSTVNSENESEILTIESENGRACVTLKAEENKLLADSFYKLSFEYRVNKGTTAEFQVRQHGSEVYFPGQKLTSELGVWGTHEIIFKPVQGMQDISIFLYTDSDGSESVSNSYRNIKLVSNGATQDTLVSIAKEKTSLTKPEKISFHKINPTKYIIQVYNSENSFPLIFSESFDKNWKLYAVPTRFENGTFIETPEKAVIDTFLAPFSDIASSSLNPFLTVGSKYISKEIKGSIQNDNLSEGNFWDTFFPNKQIYEIKDSHYIANGYANVWLVDSEKICRSISCANNSSGQLQYTLIVEYWPQRWFYLGLLISGTTLAGVISYLLFNFVRRRKTSKITRLNY